MAALNPFAGSLPIWPIMVTSRRAVGSIRLRQSPRCSGRRSLQPSSDRHACTRCVCRSAVSPPRRPRTPGTGNLGRKAICKTSRPRMIQSPPRSRYSCFSGAAKPRGQSPRRIRPPVRFRLVAGVVPDCAQVRGMLDRAGQLARRDGGYALRALRKKKKRNPEKEKPPRKIKISTAKKILPAGDTVLTGTILPVFGVAQ